MKIQVTGKNVETSAAFQDYVNEKINGVLEKYVGLDLDGHVRLEKERGRFTTTCSIHLATGLNLEATGDGVDAYASTDVAMEHLEKRVRRYKRRLKNHHHGAAKQPFRSDMAPDYHVDLQDHETDGDGEGWDAGPVIVAETQREVRELPVSAAVLQLDLTDEPFLVFRNAANGGINVVYRRKDGNIGWIDPAPSQGTRAVRAAGTPRDE
jgi:ribosomal subunit interface protein